MSVPPRQSFRYCGIQQLRSVTYKRRTKEHCIDLKHPVENTNNLPSPQIRIFEVVLMNCRRRERDGIQRTEHRMVSPRGIETRPETTKNASRERHNKNAKISSRGKKLTPGVRRVFGALGDLPCLVTHPWVRMIRIVVQYGRPHQRAALARGGIAREKKRDFRRRDDGSDDRARELRTTECGGKKGRKWTRDAMQIISSRYVHYLFGLYVHPQLREPRLASVPPPRRSCTRRMSVSDVPYYRCS